MTGWALSNLLLGAAASALLVLLALAVRAASGHGAVLRYRLMRWFLGALVVLVPAQILAAALAPDWARRTVQPLRLEAIPAVIDVFYGTAPSSTALKASSVPRAATTGDDGWRRHLPRALLALYLAGAGAGVVLLLSRLRSAARLVATATVVRDPSVLASWRAVGGDSTGVRLLSSGSLSVPSAWGLWCPAVVLPTGAGTLDSRALQCALRHELTHLRRGDALATLVQHLAVALFWFNPLVHLFARRLEEDRESSCDAEVSRVTGTRCYALALLGCCRPAAPEGRTLLAPFWSPSNLERRLHMLEHALDRNSPRHDRFIAGAAGACLAAVLAASAGVAMAVSPRPAAVVQPDADTTRPDGIKLRTLRESAGTVLAAEVRPVVVLRDRRTLLRMLAEQSGGRLPDSVTEQETIASYHESEGAGAQIEARQLTLSLPEGSPLRAVFEGESIKADMTGAEAAITVQGGHIRLVDDGDVARVTVRPSAKDATVVWKAKRSSDEVAFTVSTPSGEEVRAVVELELEKGVPRGEKQPAHGSVRWALLQGSVAEKKPSRVKIQWILDIERLKQETGGAR